MHNLIEAIKERQRQNGLTDDALASLLSIDRSTWSKIKSGERNPGMKFILAVNEKLMPVEISDIIPTITSEHPLGQILSGLWQRVRGFFTKNRE